MKPEHIRYMRNQIYAARLELEKKLDMLDEDMRKLQSECQHPNKKKDANYWRCPDCDAEDTK